MISRYSLFVGLLIAILIVGAMPASAQVYLRGDLGYGWGGSAGIKDRNGASDFNCTICLDENLNSIGNSPVLGAGLGYRINDWLRGDLSVGYRGGFVLKTTDSSGTAFKSGIRSWSIFATGYIDLPVDWRGVRPFLGAGLGWANNRMSTFTQTFAGGLGNETDPSGSCNNLAWLVAAGVTVPISGPWAVDLSYRFVDLGQVGTKNGVSNLTFGSLSLPLMTNGVQGQLQNNELMLSLRYTF